MGGVDGIESHSHLAIGLLKRIEFFNWPIKGGGWGENCWGERCMHDTNTAATKIKRDSYIR